MTPLTIVDKKQTRLQGQEKKEKGKFLDGTGKYGNGNKKIKVILFRLVQSTVNFTSAPLYQTHSKPIPSRLDPKKRNMWFLN